MATYEAPFPTQKPTSTGILASACRAGPSICQSCAANRHVPPKINPLNNWIDIQSSLGYIGSSVMLPEDFHPIVRRWWESRFRDPAGSVLPPTEAQLEGWRAIRTGQHALIAAPTGSGKTLAAFLVSMDGLLRESLEGGDLAGPQGLPDEVRVIYVSPLKALSADIHKNL